jgi:hypothetical protein
MNSSIVPVGDPAGEEEDLRHEQISSLNLDRRLAGHRDEDDTQLSIASHSLDH